MGYKPIIYKGKPLSVHKAVIKPDFNNKTVLVEDKWDFVEMWLRREHHEKALIYWNQAKYFYNASIQLPKTSSPLTAYYCFLNASKALLLVNRISFSEHHGVTGATVGNSAFLINEKVRFMDNGILAGLCRYFDEPTNGEYSLKDLFYNIPYIHRAYSLTYTSQPELFIPIKNPVFVKKTNSPESWFCAELTKNVANSFTIKKLPDEFERDESKSDSYIIRRKSRFKWRRGDRNNLLRLTNYHRGIRKHVFYIHSNTRLWYIKRKTTSESKIDRCSTTITYACMHRLSELARYSPMLFARHFESNHNWLLTEYIALSLNQFIDRIASEITRQEFMIPGVRKS